MIRRPRPRAEARAARQFGDGGELPAGALLVTKLWHRAPRKQFVYVGVEGIGYVKLDLVDAEQLGRRIFQLGSPLTDLSSTGEIVSRGLPGS